MEGRDHIRHGKGREASFIQSCVGSDNLEYDTVVLGEGFNVATGRVGMAGKEYDFSSKMLLVTPYMYKEENPNYFHL